MHTGGSSPFNKKEWVIKEWSMCTRAITVSSFLFLRGQTIHSFSTGNIWCNLFSGNSSHSDCHSSNILFVRDFRSENGMSSTEMSPTRESLAAVWRWGKREIIYLSVCFHHQNDSACIKMGSDENHFNVSLIVRDKVHHTAKKIK